MAEYFMKNTWLVWAVFVICLVVLLCGVASAETLKASWYSENSLKKEGTWAFSHGVMANGQPFNENALTVACRLFKLGSRLKVTNLNNGKSVIVKVTDKIGKKFAKTRIDLSKGAFQKIADLKQGLIEVKVEEL